jgi:hypothetical protein
MENIEPEFNEGFQSGQKTAKKAAAILVEKDLGFMLRGALFSNSLTLF